MNKIVVLDTNVLLADPNSVLSFPRAEVVIPETVLSELDKLKTARVDPDLRFRGREVSRILFDLSEEGSLVDGVELPDGGTLRVMPFDADTRDLPEGISARNADDRILITALQVQRACRSGLRCPTHHERPQHAAQGPDPRHSGRALRQRRRGQLRQALHHPAIPALPRAAHDSCGRARRVRRRRLHRHVLAAGARRRQACPRSSRGCSRPTSSRRSTRSNTLQTNPNDTEALLKMANIYFDANGATAETDAGAAIKLRTAGNPLLRALPEALAARQRRSRRPRHALLRDRPDRPSDSRSGYGPPA